MSFRAKREIFPSRPIFRHDAEDFSSFLLEMTIRKTYLFVLIDWTNLLNHAPKVAANCSRQLAEGQVPVPVSRPTFKVNGDSRDSSVALLLQNDILGYLGRGEMHKMTSSLNELGLGALSTGL